MGDVNLGFTLDEALSSIGFGYFHVVALFYAGLGWASFAMGMTLLSIIGPAVKSEWGLSSSQEGMLTSIVFAGTIVGAFVFGYISDAHGRRMSSVGTIITTGGALCLASVAPNYHSLLLALALFGFGAGGAHVFASWFLEFAPTCSRGSWTAAISLFYSIGNILATLLAMIVMPSLGWRWLVATSVLPPVFVLLVGSLVPESPRYLCMKGKSDEAYRVLEKVSSFNRTEIPPGDLVICSSTPKDEEYASPEQSPLLRKKNCGSHYSSVLILFSRKLLKTTLLVWVLYFTNIFAYYGIIFLTSEMSSSHSHCRSSPIVSENVEDTTSYGEVFINSLAELPSAFIAAAVVDRAGRKLSIIMTSVLSFILLLPLVWHQNDITTTVLLFGTRLFVSAGTMVLCVYASEVYPTSVRSTGVGIMNSIGNTGGIVCPLVAVVLIENCHQGAAITLFEVVFVAIVACVLLLPVETNGKELSDTIQSDEDESSSKINTVR